MSIFGMIKDAIFGKSAEAAEAGTSGESTGGGSAPAAPGGGVDVAAILNDLASKNSQKLNWKTSIVDLMKLLDMDSSYSNRKDLAKELNFDGDMNDSASMNIWLHKQVMIQLAENGGVVPDDLKD
jgi:Domain of unknown function (DUF3597)